MNNRLPSHIVPISLVADVSCYINNFSANIKELKSFTGKSESYIRSSLTVCRILNIIDKDGKANNFLRSLGKTPNDDLKLNVMRKFIQEYEPFLIFIQYHLNGETLDESARKVYVSYRFEGQNPNFLKELFISWGTSTGIFISKENSITLGEPIKKQLTSINTLSIDLDNDMAIRIYISDFISVEIFSTLTSVEIEELIDAYKKCSTDARGAIECAGRAFEDYLRRLSLTVDIDVSRKNGIVEIIKALYNNRDVVGGHENKIHNKHESIGATIGHIRNMAGHSLEARTMERWDLTTYSAKMYIELVLTSIRSIFFYTRDLTFSF